MKKRMLSVVLAGFMAVSAVPVHALAVDAVLPVMEQCYASSGTCGETVTWTLDSAGTLTISGTGSMYDYNDPDGSDAYVSAQSAAPWYAEKDSISKVVIASGVTKIGRNCFYGLDHVTTVTIAESAATISYAAFMDCSALTTVSMGSGVTDIEDRAFQNCARLHSVTIPSGVTHIGQCAFMKCSELKEIIIPDSVTAVDAFAFYSCSGLKKAVIGDGVTTIGTSAFENCSSLTDVTFGKKVASIGEGAFQVCGALTEINLPDSVTEIGRAAFAQCTSLTSVTVPGSVTTLGRLIFSRCTGLKNAVLEEGISELGSEMFYQCSSLESVSLPNTMKKIPYQTFYGCTSLTKLTIPKGVTEIYSKVFENCSNLKDIYFTGNAPSFSSSSLEGFSGNAYYPKAASGWTSAITQQYGGTVKWIGQASVYDLFSDVKATDWFVTYVQYVYDTGLMSGTSDTQFSPNSSLTRAMIAQILYSNAGKPSVSDKAAFSDVKKGTWYFNAIQWASENGIVSGLGNDMFGPMNLVTREQLAVMLYAHAGKPSVSGSLSGYEDSAAVSSWAKTAMTWAVKSGIISGISDDGKMYLRPQGNATRAQTAVMLMQYLEK